MAICNNKKCSLGECDQPETCTAYVPVITNADRIRAMSDEELRNWLFQRDCTNIAAFLEYGGIGVMNAVQLLEWLKQPAEEVGKWGN